MQYQSKAALGRVQILTPSDASPTCAPFDFDLKAALLAGDIVEIGVVPAGARVLDVTLVTDKLDNNGTPTASLDIGLMSGTPGELNPARTCGNEFFAADQTARAGGSARMSKREGFTLAKSAADRAIGVKVNAIATGAPTGRISLLVWYSLAG